MSASGQGQRDARSQPATAARNDDCAAAAPPQLIEDFEADRALPGDDRGIAKLGTTVAPLSSAYRAAISSRLSLAPVVEDDLGPFGPCPFDLHLRRIDRHHDDRVYPQAAGRDRHSTRVIARRKSDHAALALFGR